MMKINLWMRTQGQVSSGVVKAHILRLLTDDDVALMYKSQLDLC